VVLCRGGASCRLWRLEEAAFGVSARVGHGGARWRREDAALGRGRRVSAVAFQGRGRVLGGRLGAAARVGWPARGGGAGSTREAAQGERRARGEWPDEMVRAADP
jgi:hypothetical protein